jgi:DNA polymerase elongation subunit (family B)
MEEPINSFYGDELIFDIETTSLNTSTAVLKYLGAYSYKFKQYYFYTHKEVEKIALLFSSHRVLIGHNIRDYDIPVMKNGVNKMNFFDYKVQVDTLQISRKKLTSMINDKGEKIKSVRFSLDETYKKLFTAKSGAGKLAFNYSLLQKPLEELTSQELEDIKNYTLNDVRITKEVFEEFVKQFSHLKSLMDEKNQRNYKWIVKNYGAYAYSVLCKELNIEEKYSNFDYDEEVEYRGADVLDIAYPELHGNCYLIDFSSEYPHSFLQFNLFTPCEENSKEICKECHKKKYFFNGNELFKINGEYCIYEQGAKEQLIKKLYGWRKELKSAKDPREAAIKVVLNSLYGITAKPTFTWVYYPNRAADCCTIGRHFLRYAELYFTERGCLVGYGDTDSIFMQAPESWSRDDLQREIDSFIAILKKYMPFPSDTFTMAIEKKIKDAWFINKKMYLYLAEDNTITIKGLPIMKVSAALLSQLIYDKYLKTKIINERKIKFPKSLIMSWISEELKKDLSLAAAEFNISDLPYNNTTSLQSQIQKKYGPGKILLVKNRRLGIGKGVKYCLMEEAKKLHIYEIDLTTILEELSPFYYDDYKRTLQDYK